MTPTMTKTAKGLLFNIHGVGVRFVTDSPLLVEPATMLMRYFQQETLPYPPVLTLYLGEVTARHEIPVRVPAAAELLCTKSGQAAGDTLRQKWQCTISKQGGTLFVDFHEQGLVVIETERGVARGYLVRPDAMHTDILDSYVHFMLTELLRYHGLYTMHATSLEKNGRGVLIPGFSAAARRRLSSLFYDPGIVTCPTITPCCGMSVTPSNCCHSR